MFDGRKLKWFLKTALSYLGTPYIWGGDDPSGFDCSGFVIECLKSIGLLPEDKDFTADGLLRLYGTNIIRQPEPGALMFFLKDGGIAYHVEICLDSEFRIGASGGGSKTKTPNDSWQDNAFVKIRPIDVSKSRIIFVKL